MVNNPFTTLLGATGLLVLTGVSIKTFQEFTEIPRRIKKNKKFKMSKLTNL